jgi:predicted dehydrogenase
MSPKSKFHRRTFIKNASVATFTALSASRVLGANERIGVGVIGTGGRGHSHLRVMDTLKDEANLRLVAVCDTYRPRLKTAAERYGAEKQYMDHRELLADNDIDAVSIATPDHIHGYQVVDAVQAGKDVYCEKPVTHWRQFDLTRKLAREVKKSKQVFLLGTQGMSDGAWHQMRTMVQDGLIGQPIHAECGYFRVGDWGERGMPIDDANAEPGADLNWEQFLGDSPNRDFDVSRYFRWRMYADYAGGPVTDLFPHSFTPVASILGLKMPDKVVATGGKFRYQEREIPDTFNLLIDYDNELTVAVMGTQGNPYPGVGARGAGQRIPVIRGWEGALTIEGNDIAFYPTPGGKQWDDSLPNTQKRLTAIRHDEDFTLFWKHFFTCIRERNLETWSDAQLAYHVQTAFHMAMLGYLEEKVAKFDKAQEKIIL